MTNTAQQEGVGVLPRPPPVAPSTPGFSTNASFSTIPSVASSPYVEKGEAATSRRYGTPNRSTTTASSRLPPGSSSSSSIHGGAPPPRIPPYDGGGGYGSAFHSANPSRMASPMRGNGGGGGDDSSSQYGGRSVPSQQAGAAGAAADLLSVHYGARIVLKRPSGRALSAHSVEGQNHYGLGLAGSALGDPLETFTLNSTTRRDDKGPVLYGSVLTLRCPWAKEKCLALQASGQVGFFRSLTGSFEKWTLQRPEIVHSGRSTPVSAGDQVVLVSHNGQLLMVNEEGAEEDGGTTADVTTIEADQARLCKATWEVCFAGIPHYPSWRLSRMYLTGDFLLKPERHHGQGGRLTAQQEELYGLLSHAAHRLQPKVEPLSTYPVETQEQLLMEDLLGTISGYEGRYIKVVIGSSTKATAGTHDDSGTTTTAVERKGGVEVVSFALDVDSVDRSLASVAAKFFPLGARVVRIRRFIELKKRPDYGMVAQALAAGLQSVLKEYMVQVAQLEHKWRQRNLSLTKMWFFLQPSLRTLEILDNLCHKVHGAKGGALLNLIRASESGGDDKSAKLHAFLLQRASVPYMEMLEGWVYHGRLDDPYQEFMVREEQSLHKENVEEDFNAAYWDARYTIQTEHVFVALEEHSHHILTTGKYLNVFRECGQEVPSPPKQAEELRYTGGGSRGGGGGGWLGESIEGAYTRSCALLLDLLRKENNLLQCLSSIKHYFLLYKGDFFVHFMNVAEKVLLEDVSEVQPSRLEGLLHLSIQMSSVASSDPYKDDVSCTFARQPLLKHLTAIHQSDSHRGGGMGGLGSAAKFSQDMAAAGTQSLGGGEDSSFFFLQQQGGSDAGLKAYETFMLEYHVRWPLSLVVSRRAVTKYQLLFRHLFLTKYVERRLHSTWQDQQATKELDVRGAMGQAFCLRHRMQHFIENYVYYMMFEVIEPHWHNMYTNLLKNVQNVDDVIKMHQDFQDTCLKECLLTNQPLLKILNRIIYLCMRFASYMAMLVQDQQTKEDVVEEEERGCRVMRRTGSRPQEARRIRIKEQTEVVRQQTSSSSFITTIQNFQTSFDQHLGDFMRRLWDDSRAQYHSHLANLCTRLDYNQHLTQKYGSTSSF